jgi:hypothetical protein
MNILLLASHAVAEYDDLRMFTDLGYDVFAPGGYEVPGSEGEGIRPPLPDAPHHPDLVARLQQVRSERGEPGPAIDWGKAALHDDIIDWADAIIVHHFPDRWIGGQWERIKHKRVIWRTCGQSSVELEAFMAGFEGLQIVRYSLAERRYFERRGCFAGQDALIRFGKYPDDYGPWVGDNLAVGNITQHMQQRGDACGLPFWEEVTRFLPGQPAGPGSEVLRGGRGTLSYLAMLYYLRHIRAYLYTGTRPASYTLGLIEAMMSGTPVVSIGARAWGDDWDGADLFEAASDELTELRPIVGSSWTSDYPDAATRALRNLLESPDLAAEVSRGVRARAIELFDVATVGTQWREFLG